MPQKNFNIDKSSSIYLNNLYLGDDCRIESDKYSIRCTIKDKWYDKKDSLNIRLMNYMKVAMDQFSLE